MRAAVAHRDAEALGGAAGDVGAPLPRCLEQRQRQQVGGDDDRRARLVRRGRERPVVADGAAGTRIGQQDAERAGLGQVGRPAPGQVGDVQGDAERLGAGLQHGEGLRQGVGVDDEDGLRLGAPGAAHQRHRLGGGGRLVEHRGAGDVEAGQVGDHRLEVDQRLEPALADLGLVRRVGGVPGRVLQHGALDDGRGDGAVVPQPDHRGVDVVGRGAFAQQRPGRRPRRARRAGPAASGRGRPRGRRRRPAPRGWDDRWRPASRRYRPAAARCDGRRRTRRGSATAATEGTRPAAGEVSPGDASGIGCAAVSSRSTIAATLPARCEAPGGDAIRNGFRGVLHAFRVLQDPGGGNSTPEAGLMCEVRVGQPATRLRRRIESSSSAVWTGPPSSRSAGSSASSPDSSRSAPETAMPKTPWPPASRSTTSSAEVHS